MLARRISTIAESVVGLLLLGSKMFRFFTERRRGSIDGTSKYLEHRNIELFPDVENRDNYQ
jgi:hypothetical protein